MSTKIYNGYRFTGEPSLLDIQRIAHDIRERVKPVARKEYYTTFINLMVEAFDRNQFGFYEHSHYFIKERSNDLYWGVENYIKKRIQIMEMKQQRDYAVDFGFKFMVMPLKDSPKVLLLLYTEREKLRDVFEDTPEIEDYHYQNQTDPPEDVLEADWDQRRKDWDNALGGDGWSTPMESGFQYKPYDHERLWFFHDMTDEEKDALDTLIPSNEQRAKEIAVDLIGIEFDAANPIPLPPLPENPTKEQSEERYRAGMDQYWKFRKYLESDEGIARKKEKIGEIVPQLKQFTYKELVGVKLEFTEKINAVFAKPTKGKPYWLDI